MNTPATAATPSQWRELGVRSGGGVKRALSWPLWMVGVLVGCSRGAGSGGALGASMPRAVSRASIRAAAVGRRSSARFSRHCRTTASSGSGTSARVEGGVGGSLAWRCITFILFVPVNGGLPVRSSYRMVPRA